MLCGIYLVDENDITEVEVDKEWFCYLKKYLNQLSEEKRSAIFKAARMMSSKQ